MKKKEDRPASTIINFFEQVIIIMARYRNLYTDIIWNLKLLYSYQILDVLCYLHEDLQIAHANLSPSSIFLETDTLKIGDFGLSKDVYVLEYLQCSCLARALRVPGHVRLGCCVHARENFSPAP